MSRKTKRANKRVGSTLSRFGKSTGFEPHPQYEIGKYLRELGDSSLKKGDKIGVVDMVWLIEDKLSKHKLPVYAFEIETSWRISNQLRADIGKLRLLNCIKGFIVFPDNAFKTKAKFDEARQAIERYARTLGAPNIQFLKEEELEAISGHQKSKSHHTKHT
jgi:hypothetical protein